MGGNGSEFSGTVGYVNGKRSQCIGLNVWNGDGKDHVGMGRIGNTENHIRAHLYTHHSVQL